MNSLADAQTGKEEAKGSPEAASDFLCEVLAEKVEGSGRFAGSCEEFARE